MVRPVDSLRRHVMMTSLLLVTVASGLYACEVDRSSDAPKRDRPPSEEEAGATPTSAKPDDAPLPPPSVSDAAPPPTLPTTSFTSAKKCGSCHAEIAADWSKSMHSRALTSPLMIAETNQGIRGPYAQEPNPDPKRICVNCHSPSVARVTTGATLPLGDDSTLNNEGVSCQTCHQFNGTPTAGGGGYSKAYMAGLQPGTTVFGPLSSPAASGAHTSARSDTFDRPNTMCGNCHDVNFDRNNDGRIDKSADLVLQQTWDEYVADYKAIGGVETCVSCHMPVVAARKKVVEGTATPDRVVHDHSFVGVDYSLDDVAQRDATRAARTALLRSAAKLVIEPAPLTSDTNVSFRVTLTNSGSGHNLPTGFAFVRQMWLEVTARDAAGALVASSGLLAKPSDDLCESELLGDTASPLSAIVAGCATAGADRSLVHFQQKLVDSIEVAPDAQGNIVKDQLGQPLVRATAASREVLLQLIPAGVVPRKRPADGIALGTLRPFEARTFNYQLPATGGPATQLQVRLLFRNVAPYFVRGLSTSQPQDVPALATLVNNLEVVEMATATATIPGSLSDQGLGSGKSSPFL